MAPTVCSFRARVIEPFKEVWLNNLQDEEFVGKYMYPNCDFPVPDYGIKEHIAFECVPFFTDIQTRGDYEEWQ